MAVQVILIAHNQLDLVKLEIKVLGMFAGIEKQNIVVVDNASEDGLREWLEEEQYPSYLICDEGIENYSVILNTAIREFHLTEDILILSPEYIVLEDTIAELEHVLRSNEQVGAVTGRMIWKGTEVGKDFSTALESARNQPKGEVPNAQRLSLGEDVLLIKKEAREEVGLFDERLILPYNTVLDYLFRAVCKGYQLYECADAFFYYLGAVQNEYLDKFGVDADRSAMKEKWDMNYFNDYPNMELVQMMNAAADAKINVLEIGCDCGVNLLEVKRRYPYANIYGVEINKKAAEIASHIAKVEVGNIEDKKIGFEDVKFDYIMFGDVLEHLRDPAGTIRYCRELLKEDGRIFACIPNVMHYSVMRQLVDGNFTYTDMGLLDRTHIHFFTYKEIVKMFQSEGYEIEQMGSIRTRENDEKEENVALIKALLALSSETEEYMYYAYQYLVIVRVKR